MRIPPGTVGVYKNSEELQPSGEIKHILGYRLEHNVEYRVVEVIPEHASAHASEHASAPDRIERHLYVDGTLIWSDTLPVLPNNGALDR